MRLASEPTRDAPATLWSAGWVRFRRLVRDRVPLRLFAFGGQLLRAEEIRFGHLSIDSFGFAIVGDREIELALLQVSIAANRIRLEVRIGFDRAIAVVDGLVEFAFGEPVGSSAE